ncbi:MAG: hypothetical protein LBJ00_08970 [Planctomycetaceae bacterium]|jgi:hypothetical protein|nr:hypothetical protein [Planctomycetaceae bacterium]
MVECFSSSRKPPIDSFGNRCNIWQLGLGVGGFKLLTLEILATRTNHNETDFGAPIWCACSCSSWLPKPVWAVGFAHEQSLHVVTLACSAP